MEWRFRVDGDLPPKKDGANSMWGKDGEVQRLVKLRLAAQAVLGDQAPLGRSISLTIEIHIGSANTPATGDLDNFIAGICDGLMLAGGRCMLATVWELPELAAIHPRKWSGIIDDGEVMEITARKIVGDAERPWYTVLLRGSA